MYDFKDLEDFKEKCGYVIDGYWYPRVTKIVEIKSKPALYYFYGQAASYDAAKKITEQSAKEGSLVHEVAEKILIGENPAIPEEIAPAINAFREFFDIQNIQVDKAFVEKRIFHP